MRCPSLADLPSPGVHSGWPWTEESRHLLPTMLDGRPWPRISVVTPSYNQAQFLEETIRSVLLQGYPDLEYIVMDGGSTDGSVEIIRRYEPWLTFWVSEKDRGQSHAINKGFQRCTGEIAAWLNSDDVYHTGALAAAATGFAERPDVSFLYGILDEVDEQGVFYRAKGKRWDYEELLRHCYIGQPATFMRRRSLVSAGYLDESLHYALDWELWIRLGLAAPAAFIDAPVAKARMWYGCKTFNRARPTQEHGRVLVRLLRQRALPPVLRTAVRSALVREEWHQASLNLGKGNLIPTATNAAAAFYHDAPYTLLRIILPPVLKALPLGLWTVGRIRRIGRCFKTQPGV